MAAYSDPDRLRSTAATLFSRLADDPTIRKRTEKIEAVFRFEIEEPEVAFTLSIDRGRLTADFTGQPPARAVLRMDGDVFHQAMAGTLNLPMALVTKTLRIEGDTRAVLSLTALGKTLNDTYNALWAEREGERQPQSGTSA